MIIAVKFFFTIATIQFGLGLLVRRRSVNGHRALMGLGLLSTLGIAIVIMTGVHAFGAQYGAAPWLVNAVGSDRLAAKVLIAHRMISTLTLVLLLCQVWSGVRRSPWHRRLWRALVPLWIVSYLTGMVIFV